jgi:hypothetical protein
MSISPNDHGAPFPSSARDGQSNVDTADPATGAGSAPVRGLVPNGRNSTLLEAAVSDNLLCVCVSALDTALFSDVSLNPRVELASPIPCVSACLALSRDELGFDTSRQTQRAAAVIDCFTERVPRSMSHRLRVPLWMLVMHVQRGTFRPPARIKRPSLQLGH